MTSKQIDAIQQRVEADDALYRALAQDYPERAAKIAREIEDLKAWADSNPVPE